MFIPVASSTPTDEPIDDGIPTIKRYQKVLVELRDVIMLRTNQSFKIDPKILEQWDPIMLVIKRSPWTNMRLMLNKVANDNITDLFPSDWSSKPLFSEMQEKHFKVMSEVMTDMFHQCGVISGKTFWRCKDSKNSLRHYITIWSWAILQLPNWAISSS